MYGVGIPWEGTVLDAGIERKVVQKSGSYFSFGDERLGQGRHNATAFLREHPDVTQQILAALQVQIGPDQVVSAQAAADRRAGGRREGARRGCRSSKSLRRSPSAPCAPPTAPAPSSTRGSSGAASTTPSGGRRSTSSSASATSTTSARRRRAPSGSPSAATATRTSAPTSSVAACPTEEALAATRARAERATRFTDQGAGVARAPWLCIGGVTSGRMKLLNSTICLHTTLSESNEANPERDQRPPTDHHLAT